jgi:hypothetical protein
LFRAISVGDPDEHGPLVVNSNSVLAIAVIHHAYRAEHKSGRE